MRAKGEPKRVILRGGTPGYVDKRKFVDPVQTYVGFDRTELNRLTDLYLQINFKGSVHISRNDLIRVAVRRFLEENGY